MVIPLKNPLENRLTVLRLLRHMNIDADAIQYPQLCDMVYNSFKGVATKVNQRRTPKSRTTKVCCYPPDFLPEMKSIVENFINGNNEKELRLQKQRDFLNKKKLKSQ